MRANRGKLIKTRASLAVALVAVGLAGCGSSSSNKQQVRDTFNKAVHELAARNPAACTLFTKSYALENTGLSNYQAALARCRSHTIHHGLSLPPGLRVESVRIKGNKATLTAKTSKQGSGVFQLLNQSGTWKINSVTAR